jgi:hypothetical protein
MAEKKQLEFFLLRYVPDAVKDEFVNIGVVMVEPGVDGQGGFADVRFTRDWRRVRCLDPGADIEAMEALERDIRGRLGEAQSRQALIERLQDSLSNTIQLSASKGILAEDPRREMGELARYYLETARHTGARQVSGRQRILKQMQDAFERSRAWALMEKNIAAAQYTYKGDPLNIDCGYRANGALKLFHAVSLGADVNSAKVLAFSYPQMQTGIRRLHNAEPLLTAVVEDDLDRGNDEIAFALATLERTSIAVAEIARLPELAETARLELRA